MRTIVNKAVSPIKIFLEKPAATGILLFLAGAIALTWANLHPETYAHLLHFPISMDFGLMKLSYPIEKWVNDGLMVLFFYIIGMEVKYEITRGELNSVSKAGLPIVATLGGAIMPALIYMALNGASPYAHGWGIPLATDIAFAIGVLSLLGKGINPKVRLFLMVLAVIDDLIAILIIAFFYTKSMDLSYLGLAGICCLGLACLNYFKFYAPPLRIFLSLLIWAFTLKSGIHATIVGVVIGFLTPIDGFKNRPHTSLHAKVGFWTPYVNFLILPIFALLNSGVKLSLDLFSTALGSSLSWGIFLGLLIGKPLGIVSFSFISHKLKFFTKPNFLSWSDLLLISFLAAIGFTMALLIGDLAFRNPEEASIKPVMKLSVLAASVTAIVLSFVFISFKRNFLDKK